MGWREWGDGGTQGLSSRGKEFNQMSTYVYVGESSIIASRASILPLVPPIGRLVSRRSTLRVRILEVLHVHVSFTMQMWDFVS